jgi:Domain of unknown function (DUF4158)
MATASICIDRTAVSELHTPNRQVLSADDLALVRTKRGPSNRLGCAVQLGQN